MSAEDVILAAGVGAISLLSAMLSVSLVSFAITVLVWSRDSDG